jgi:CRP-like cAMP-binding protein
MSYLAKQIHCTDCKNRSSCFSVLSELDHKFVESNRVELRFKAGEVICKQGAFASSIMYVYDGMVKTYLETPEGSHVVLNVLPTGSMIGLCSLFTDYIYHQSAAALVNSTVCSVDIKVFEEFVKSNGEFASEIIKTLNQCIMSNNDRFLSLTHKQLNGRFADAMIFLSEKVYNSKKFTLTMMRKDLAELTGMSPESISRVITQFKKDGIIDVKDKDYEILRMDRLEEISIVG